MAAQAYPDGTFTICPRFVEFNARAQRDLSRRYEKHNKQRSVCVVVCANATLAEVLVPVAADADEASHPQFVENANILLCSMNEMKEEIHRTQTVHAHKCTTAINTFQEFNKKAINRQDQNSWKISGKFFARYIAAFVAFLDATQMNERQKNLAKITFACKLLHSKVKFERAKQKPLIRDRTLVMSVPLHSAFKQLDARLDVHQYYLLEKAKRKKIKKKVVSSQFHHDICQFCQYLLQSQKLWPTEVDVLQYEFPQDWLIGASSRDLDEHKTAQQDEPDADDDTLHTESVSFSNQDDEEGEDEDHEDEDHEDDEEDDGEDKYVYNYIHVHLHNEVGALKKATRAFQSMHGFGVSQRGIQKPFSSTARTHDCDAYIARLNANWTREEIISSPPQPSLFAAAVSEEENDHFEMQISSPTAISRVGSDTIMAGSIHTNEMGYSYNH